MKSGNPVLNERAFSQAGTYGSSGAMTIQGAVGKSFILLFLAAATALWTWGQFSNPQSVLNGSLMVWVGGGAIAGFIIVLSTLAIGLFYLVSIVAGFFGVQIPLIHSSGGAGIAFSLLVVTVAALNLVLDFNLIEQASQEGAPKYMEWYSAFALLVTLVWLYIEILRLLSKLSDRK